MHKLETMNAEIEHTHSGLGRFLCFNIVAAVARKCVLNVAVAGIGKSTVTWALKEIWKNDVHVYDSITRAGLKFISEEMNNFNGVVIIDDLGKVDTKYSRMATVTTFAELCYSHFVRKITYNLEIRVENFNGAALMNIQPVLLHRLCEEAEWEAVIRDKTIRYYHFIRPLHPTATLPKIKLKRKRRLNIVKNTTKVDNSYKDLIQLGLTQWSYPRTIQHIDDLLKAAAYIDDRVLVHNCDKVVLLDLLRPMMIERYFMRKFAFESALHFDDNAACLFTELCSFNPLTIAQLCADFKITSKMARTILKQVEEYCYVEVNSEPVVKPTALAKELLEEMGGRRGI